ncbi:MAG: hypothetical protein QHJ82_14130, partial [Verrucomicrobiota bacterium]|nr:hypothetical protein [Verrucomicrobiota bacterium]
GGLISALFPATESQGIFPSPAWLKVRGGARAGGVAHWATLVPATPGWEICGPTGMQRRNSQRVLDALGV